jgi:hypothetical protein
MIYSDSVPSDYFYIVSSGTAAVKSATSGTLLTKLTSGGHFGERNLRKLTPEEKAKKKPVQVSKRLEGRRGPRVCCMMVACVRVCGCACEGHQGQIMWQSSACSFVLPAGRHCCCQVLNRTWLYTFCSSWNARKEAAHTGGDLAVYLPAVGVCGGRCDVCCDALRRL